MLFAALFQALRYCPPDRRLGILETLESGLGFVVHDLAVKLESLLSSDASSRDRIQGLWLLYLSLELHHRADIQMWIGPDVFSDDDESHLRVFFPDNMPPALKSGLVAKLEILAQSVTNTAGVTLRQGVSGELVVELLDVASSR